jgi:outer membrane protein TolC
MKNKVSVAVVICLLFSAITIYAAESNNIMTLSKEEVINLAFKNNAEIVKLEKDLEIAKEKLVEAKASFYPKVDLSSSYTRLGEAPVTPDFTTNPFSMKEGSPNSYSFQLGLQYPLYMGGQIRIGYEQAQKDVEMAELNLKQKQHQLREEVLTQYYNILQAKKMVELSKQNINKIERYVEIAQANKEVGIFTNTEVLQARINLIRGQQGLLKAENGLKLAKLALKNTLSLEDNVILELNDELNWQEVQLTEEEVKEYAFANRIEFKLLDLTEDKLELGLDAVKGSRYPTISLASSYSTQSDKLEIGDGDWNVTLMLNYELFDGGIKKSKIKQTEKELEKFHIDKKQARDGIELEIKQSLLKLSEAKKSIELMKLSLEESKKNLNDTELKYQEGIITSFDVLNAQTTLQEVQTDYYQAIYDYNLAVVNLERVMAKVID